MYDGQIGRWHTIDIMSEKYFGETSYNYVLNNPITFIDYDGMDVYIMTSDGRTVLAKKEDKADMLYVTNNKGEIIDTDNDGKTTEKDAAKVKSKGMIGQLTSLRILEESRKKPGHEYENMYSIVSEKFDQAEDDLLNLFHFVSKYVKVEFTLIYFRYNQKSYISLGTHNQGTYSPGPDDFGIERSDVYKMFHNHFSFKDDYVPGCGSMERMTMGECGGKPWKGDYANIIAGKVEHPFYVFFPKSTNLYNVTQKGIDFIRKISNKHKRLKF